MYHVLFDLSIPLVVVPSTHRYCTRKKGIELIFILITNIYIYNYVCRWRRIAVLVRNDQRWHISNSTDGCCLFPASTSCFVLTNYLFILHNTTSVRLILFSRTYNHHGIPRRPCLVRISLYTVPTVSAPRNYWSYRFTYVSCYICTWERKTDLHYSLASRLHYFEENYYF